MINKRKKYLALNTEMAIVLFAVCLFLCKFSIVTFADTEKIEVPGKVYEFEKKDNYEISKASIVESTGENNTYGTFYINGDVSDEGEENGVPSYKLKDNNLKIFYTYEDTKLKADKDSWHLVTEKSKKVAGIDLKSGINKGAIIVQTSKDRKNWVNIDNTCNVFSDIPIQADPIYSATDVELINGCYYRIIVAYKLSIRTKKNSFLFINQDKYDSRRVTEVYEFYACSNNRGDTPVDPDQVYKLGTKVRTEKFEGYFGEKLITKGDAHYGWDIGEFFVNGYTDKVTDTDGNAVFLKNINDKVTLWFRLNQDINHLNGKKHLSVTADKNGYDQYFETPKMDFGRGLLIIRYTDYNNVKSDPIYYVNFLEANTSVGADTKVQLFDEGDYEVALDYEITSDELVDKIGHYRIFFKFAVRNGNCMAYPLDSLTGSELGNSSMTENGFRLDLAKSRYLKVNLKREVLKDTADGLVEDTRFNGPAKDGDEYTDEGIYTITIENEYTGQSTTKKIYVGTNDVLHAHVVTGLPIPEIKDLIKKGATISEDGDIQLAMAEPINTTVTNEYNEERAIETDTETEVATETVISTDIEKQEKNVFLPTVIIVIIFCILIVVGVFAIKKKNDGRGGIKQ